MQNLEQEKVAKFRTRIFLTKIDTYNRGGATAELPCPRLLKKKSYT